LIRSEVALEKLRNLPNPDSHAIIQLQDEVAGFRTSLFASAHEVEA